MSARPVLVALPGNESLARGLVPLMDGAVGAAIFRHFPDGESYVRLDPALEGRVVALVCTLDRPDAKFLPLLFAARTARTLGAAQVGLIAPYLAYMRQDKRFHPGEALNAAVFASALAPALDWLVTVDPHLHRIHALADLYPIPCRVLHAAPLLAAWIGANVPSPVLIGPDAESAQWVSEVARGAGAPFVVLEKTRRGDTDVSVRVRDVERWRAHTPVLVDDIISTGRTMAAAIVHLKEQGLASPVCVGVHAVFAEGAHQALQAAGAGTIVTTNTIAHPSNAIDVTALVAGGAAALAAAG